MNPIPTTHSRTPEGRAIAAVSASALLLGCLAAPAAQAQSGDPPWERVGMYEGRMLYFDPSTLRRSGSRVQAWVLTDLKEPNATARGRQYQSKKALLEFDCSNRMMTLMQDTWYPRKMGQGEPVFQTTGAAVAAFPVQSETSGELFWKAVCGRR